MADDRCAARRQASGRRTSRACRCRRTGSDAEPGTAQARAAARETAWAQRIETRGGLPQTSAAGASVPGLVLDMDASIVICHSDKESATPTWKHSFGYHPLFCFLDNTREALSGMLREG